MPQQDGGRPDYRSGLVPTTFSVRGDWVGLHVLWPEKWTGCDLELAELQKGIDSCISYVLEGALARDHHQLSESRGGIVINCVDAPDEQVQALLDDIGRQLGALGARLECRPRL